MASDVELLEVFRLAEAAVLPGIVGEVGERLAWAWISQSRFREVDQLTRRSLTVQAGPGTLLAAGRALHVLGEPVMALERYQQALEGYRTDHDRAREAGTLNNIGSVRWKRGELVAALDFYQQALVIRREVGDRAGEAVARFNIAMVQRGQGRLDEAIAELEQVVDLDRLTHHPDLDSDTEVLQETRRQRRSDRSGQGDS